MSRARMPVAAAGLSGGIGDGELHLRDHRHLRSRPDLQSSRDGHLLYAGLSGTIRGYYGPVPMRYTQRHDHLSKRPVL